VLAPLDQLRNGQGIAGLPFSSAYSSSLKKIHLCVAVSFTAHMSQLHVPVDDTPLVFNVVLNNEGNAYNESSGVFTAPYTDTYVFHFLVLNDQGLPFIQIALVSYTRDFTNP
jgi:hypothetical protein